jgi:hypothetical protein
MAIYEVDGLPEAPLAAAAQFHARHVPLIELLAMASDESLTIVFAAAEHTHRGWRLAAVQMLARSLAPKRLNAVSGNSGKAIIAATEYLARAPGLTGQLISLDDEGAGAVIASRS